MNGLKRAVVDTNVLFMAAYNPEGKAGKIINFANEGKISLFAPDSVKEELLRVLQRELNFSEDESSFFISRLPVNWVEKQVYLDFIEKTKVKHKADKPVEAVSLALGCGILSADNHFAKRIDVNKLIEELS